MQFMSDAEFAGRLLEESERNLRISRNIQAARRNVLSMAAALLLLACVVVGEAQSADRIVIAIVGFVLGYGVRAIVGHMRRVRRRR
jgi:hypothetical protein